MIRMNSPTSAFVVMGVILACHFDFAGKNQTKIDMKGAKGKFFSFFFFFTVR